MNYLCIDIGTGSIKAVEKSADGRILRWGMLEKTDGPLQSSIQPLDEALAIHYLKTLVAEMHTESQDAVVSLPAFEVFTAIAPAVDPQYIPMSPNTFKLEAFPVNNKSFFLVAVPKEIIAKYKRIIRNSGLNLVRLELESVAVARVFADLKEPVLVMDVGRRSTAFTLVEKGMVNFLSHTDFALASNARNVIINKARVLANQRGAKKIVLAPKFAVVNGLYRVSQ